MDKRHDDMTQRHVKAVGNMVRAPWAGEDLETEERAARSQRSDNRDQLQPDHGGAIPQQRAFTPVSSLRMAFAMTEGQRNAT